MGFNVFSKGLQLEALNHGKNLMNLIKIQDDSCSFIKGVQMWRVSGMGRDRGDVQNTGGRKGNKERKKERKRRKTSSGE